jgi:hypothetical protein
MTLSPKVSGGWGLRNSIQNRKARYDPTARRNRVPGIQALRLRRKRRKVRRSRVRDS